ncbi:MAG: glycoside hydrolase family 97 protein [Saprospiraceae bacterium]|nr:glycoside hydrolase family 97 protein [Saprospiraceae bacterium]MCB9325118.1 glycoside hydrolase family 97 protein [Lewinellaceae bacterium]
MRFQSLTLLTILGLFISGCGKKGDSETPATRITSPNGSIAIAVSLDSAGHILYAVNKGEMAVIKPSGLGFEFKDWPAMDAGFEITGSTGTTIDETWEMPWGEQQSVRNNCNELVVNFEESGEPGRKLNLIFRAYDDGVAFRYEIPQPEGMDSVIIMDENTAFQLTGNHKCWWIPGDWDIYEHLYNTTDFSGIDAISKRNHPNLAQTYIPENAVNTPVTMKTADGLYLSFHEANLTNYSGMTLKVDPEHFKMTSELVGSDITGYKAKVPLPFKTPWRTIQISEKAADLINSKLILNVNEPNKLGDVSWFKPKKYVGIWWEMHLGKSSWDMASGKHGATTQNAKSFIDFAAANNIGGLLVEGWNTGWEHWIGFEDREGVFDFVTPYPDYDLEEVVRYANEKGVEIIMHHETSAAPRTYDLQMDTAYALMQKLGIHSVKTGYVGKIIPKGEYHHGQWMVNHYRRAIETAAKYDVAVNAHEPIKDTGIRRTYPNAISREGLRGQEFNAWATDGGNPPEHLPIIAFTRMLAGPIDYTPGIFKIKLAPYKPDNQVNTTLAQQLALYVVIYSPIQMAADLIEHYEGQPGLQFIRDVGVDWETSIALDGEPGDFVTIARKEKGTGNWFLGSITDENPRQESIVLDFLDKDKKYTARIYADGDNAHWDNNPTDLKITEMEVDATTVLDVKLAAGGGVAVSILVK